MNAVEQELAQLREKRDVPPHPPTAAPVLSQVFSGRGGSATYLDVVQALGFPIRTTKEEVQDNRKLF